MSIARKLVLAFGGTIIVAVVAMVFIAVEAARDNAVSGFTEGSLREIRQVDGVITGFFDQISRNTAYMASHPAVRRADSGVTSYLDTSREMSMTPEDNGDVEAEIFGAYDRFASAHPELAYVYMATEEGGYVQWPKGRIGAGYDPRERPWYGAAKASPNETVMTDAYYFSTDDVAIVSFEHTIRDGRGEVIGVQGMDVSLETLTERVADIEFGDEGYLMLVEDTGTVLVDPSNPDHNFHNLGELEGGDYARLAERDEGSVALQIGGKAYQASIYTSPGLGWKFIGLIPRSEMMAAANRVTIQMAAVGVAVIVVAIFVALLIARYLTRPIVSVTEKMRDIAEGEGDLTQRLPVHGRDEMTDLAEQFNAFVDKVRRAISEVSGTTQQLASSAEELNQVAAQTQDVVRQQSNETDQIASAINEMTATVQEISRNSGEVETSASQADERARDGNRIVAENRDSMDTLATDIQRTSEAVAKVEARSQEIRTVLDVIYEVTEQTNLLALNAAIEAARAGEQGRGFAVVAEEVRALAKRSNESAVQIREIIDGLTTDTAAAVEIMDRSRERSVRNQERANEAGEALRAIEEAVAGIHGQITQVATAAEEQSQVAEEINRNIAQIVEAAGSSSEGMDQTRTASDELARLGETLREVVGRFRV
ncbi:methyl-accepting chemotaxis protein [Arhodomonas aquaeolei]|uniref:methyl-accepting chemotaxis protein n=1 Tax=Arhodomonas TaxID=2368 RepID=UPI0013D613A8|nr:MULTISPECIES: methyl-accepting chemotaxis protein [Arhodomonas]MCS4505684.1 methyl-accepting chemotaxis protein [Arhodomonas aquaeolei]